MGDLTLYESPPPEERDEPYPVSPIPNENSASKPQKTKSKLSCRRPSTDRCYIPPVPDLTGKVSPNQGRLITKRPLSGAVRSRKNSGSSSRRGSKTKQNGLDLDLLEEPGGDEIYLRIDRGVEDDNESECSIPLPESMCDEVDALSDAFTNSTIRGLQKTPPTRRTAWGQFQEHIKGISSDAMHFQMKPTSSKASVTFKEVLNELQGEISTKRRRSKTFNKKSMNLPVMNVTQGIMDESEKDNLSRRESVELLPNHEISVSVIKTSQAHHGGTLRNWMKVKHDLSDQHLDKINEDKGAWDLISRTALQLSDQVNIYMRQC